MAGDEIKTNIYLHEVAEQCRFVLIAVAELEQLQGRDASLYRVLGRRFDEQRERYGFPPRSREAQEFEQISRLMELQGFGLQERLRRTRYYIDSIINHARRVELLLWPAGKTGDAARGEQVRHRLGVTDTFPMRDRLRKLRNGWQHLDEFMDRHSYGRQPPDEADDERPSPTGFHLSASPEWVVEVNGVRLELEPVIDQVRILLAKCQLALEVFDDPQSAPFYRQQLET